MSEAFDAIILAGGRGSRMGGISKADLVVGGERLLDGVLRAASSAARIVVVGDTPVPPGVLVTREDPPGTGPAAGLVAGLAAITDPSPWTLVLACDLPDAPAAVARLLASDPDPASDGRAVVDDAGRPQHLLALYRSASLRRAAVTYGDPANRSVRGLVAGLLLDAVDPGDADPDDVDTWEQHARWEARRADARRSKETHMDEDRSTWRGFIERACAALDLDPAGVDEDAILALARTTSQSGARPMSPVSGYILGLAQGARPEADPASLLATVQTAVTDAPRPEES
ncbi:MAG TPA: NTP transferase domain-containing protein [Propionibacteriaceae bacterium]|mgnify:FL=1|nr:NTP transferase domain-containing protein [Propionibacteriaceae bacterium]